MCDFLDLLSHRVGLQGSKRSSEESSGGSDCRSDEAANSGFSSLVRLKRQKVVRKRS